MNKADLVDALESRLGGKKQAAEAIEAIFDIIIREVARGGKVGITGFGTFERADRAARTGRNPRTGQSVRIESTAVPKFRPGTAFKMYVAEPATLPESGPAAARAAAGTAAEVRAAAQAAIAAAKSKRTKKSA
ncbi:Integration host factor subunit alpha [Austwickia sp. TVS 96-490-7B]|uniref:HU family DNA-binding protein n=1 Tax=Austwickia sp. TVS 96-490-7B TaxID=2830843 RepID=UPI001C56D352|nr:HU family DNA-binding protein [Austwickia sp. TVS 96-490-7B]MBW3085781.1 Integration host factor subunit alpha [Austwickia sp. TVS 96-490-7B]